jgi:hypothetical protein
MAFITNIKHEKLRTSELISETINLLSDNDFLFDRTSCLDLNFPISLTLQSTVKAIRQKRNLHFLYSEGKDPLIGRPIFEPAHYDQWFVKVLQDERKSLIQKLPLWNW